MTDIHDLADQKAELRREMARRRKRAKEAEDGIAALTARDHLLAARLHTGAAVVSGYRPIRSELDPTPLLEAMLDAGHRLCVPVIVGPGKPLRFREWTPGAEMMEGPFGAQVPVKGEWLEPDLVIAPLLAFDRAGYRLGYGGGFYDRTLEGLRARKPVTAVGFAYAAQEVEEVPIEPTDQRLDAIVTEAGLIRPAAAGRG